MKHLICLFLTCLPLAGELIPAARLTDWTPGTRTGVIGGIPTPSGTTIDVTQAPYNADNTGATNASTAINSAIAAASSGDIVYLPAGTYRLDSAISFDHTRDGRLLRGAGASTLLKPQGSSGAVYMGGSDGWGWPNPAVPVTAGLSLNSTVLTLGDASEFPPGRLMVVMFQNQTDNAAIQAGAVPTVSVSGYDWIRRQVVRVTGRSGNVVTIAPGLYHAPGAGLTATAAVAQLQVEGSGLEDFAVDMTDSLASFPLYLEHCLNCWVRGVKVSRVANYGIYLADSLHCEVRGCEFRERRTGGTNGAGILAGTVSGSLFEDNIVFDIFPCVEINHGSCGNVFGYNLFENPPTGGAILPALDTNHAPHNSHNLHEGNVSPNLISDGYFGGESELTAFRNWLHGSCHDGSAVTYTLSLKRWTRAASIAGNVVGRIGVAQGTFSYGQPNIGNSSSTGTAEPSTGDFWNDWKATATLTTRTSDTAGTLTLASGAVADGQLMFLRWGGGTNFTTLTAGTVSGGGTVVPFTGATGSVLPAESTAVNVFTGPGGYQELDEDVENTVINKGNYLYGASGASGSMSSLGGDTLPDSLYRSSKPSFFGDLTWPPFDPTAPNGSAYDDIPAGVRWLGGEIGGGGGSPPKRQTRRSILTVSNK